MPLPCRWRRNLGRHHQLPVVRRNRPTGWDYAGARRRHRRRPARPESTESPSRRCGPATCPIWTPHSLQDHARTGPPIADALVRTVLPRAGQRPHSRAAPGALCRLGLAGRPTASRHTLAPARIHKRPYTSAQPAKLRGNSDTSTGQLTAQDLHRQLPAACAKPTSMQGVRCRSLALAPAGPARLAGIFDASDYLHAQAGAARRARGRPPHTAVYSIL